MPDEIHEGRCMSTTQEASHVAAPRVDPRLTLNELVAQAPVVLPVLVRFGLDTCCGGALPLLTAAEHHKLDLPTLLTALAEALDGGGR